MKKLFESHSLFFQRVPDNVRKYRKWIWSIFLLSLLAIAPGVGKFQLDLTDEFFFGKDDPVKIAFDRFREEFGGDESVYIVYKAKDGDVFSHESLTALRGLQEDILNYRLSLEPGESSPLDHIVDITSLINVSYLEASDDALISRQFIGDRLPEYQSDSDTYRQQAQQHPDYPLLYVSRDSAYGGILIRTDFKTRYKDDAEANLDISRIADEIDFDEFDVIDDFDATNLIQNNNQENVNQKPRTFESVEMQEYSDVMAAIRQMIDKPEYANALTYYPVGAPPMNAYVWDNMMQQVNFVMMLTLLITLLMLWVLFRSLSAVVWPILIIIAASVVTIAIFGWLDLKMNMMVNVTVLLILVVGVADSVHILSGYLYFRNQGKEHRDALNATYEKSGVAVFLTSITTAVGMLVLMIVPLVPIQRFAISASIGVMLAFIFTVFILPLMLDLWAPKLKKNKKTNQSQEGIHVIQVMLQKVEHLSHLKPNLNISIFAIIGVFFLFGVSKIEVDSNFVGIFGKDSIIQEATALVDEKMGGTQSLEIMIDMGVEDALKQPQVLNAMNKLQHFLETEIDDVVITRSLVNIVKDSNKSLNGGHNEAYSIPQDPAVLQQTLFLFNNANPTDRRKVVSDNYQKAHINVTFINMGSMMYTAIVDDIDKKTAEIFSSLKTEFPRMDITATGGLTIILSMIDYLSWSQIQGFGVALLAISAILFFLFGSWRIGLIALFPNIFPLVIVFGSMGYLNIPLDVDTLIVAPLMIGIVVDDTIHFITHYREEVIKHGDITLAINKAFREVGQAIVFTSIILSASFLTFLLLEHQGMKHFGLLSAVAISTALVAELFLLPALLLKFNVTFKDKNTLAQEGLSST